MNYKKYNQTDAVQHENGEIIFPGANGWGKYQEWLSQGNVLSVEVQTIAPEQVLMSTAADAQSRLDKFAQDAGYDSILSMVSYVNDPDPVFAADGAAAVAERSRMWSSMRTVKSEILSGTRKMPSTLEEVALTIPTPKRSKE